MTTEIEPTRPPAATLATTVNDYSARHKFELLRVEFIAPSPANPRKQFDAAELDELAASIAQDGLLEPLVVRPIVFDVTGRLLARQIIDTTWPADVARPEVVKPKWELIAGERRWRAAIRAGVRSLPAIIRSDVDDTTALKLMLVENLQRRELDPFEEAAGYRQLVDVVGMTQTEIAKSVNRGQPLIAKRLSLLKLPGDVQERIRSGALSAAHGVLLVKLADFPAVCSAVATRAVAEGRTSADLEKDILLGAYFLDKTVIRRLREGRFPLTACDPCPFHAKIKRDGDEWNVFCLKPEHFEQLNAEADAAAEARRAAIVAAALAPRPTGPEADASADSAPLATLPRTADLRWNTYKDLRHTRAPDGCSADCACRGQAIGHSGEVVDICVDPKRFEGLEKAKTRADNKARRDDATDLRKRLARVLDTLPPIGAPELVVLAAQALQPGDGTRLDKAWAEAVKRQGATIRANKFGGAAHLDELAAFADDPIRAATMARGAIEAIIGAELLGYHEGTNSGPTLARWYLNQREHRPAATPSDAAEYAPTAPRPAPGTSAPDDGELLVSQAARDEIGRAIAVLHRGWQESVFERAWTLLGSIEPPHRAGARTALLDVLSLQDEVDADEILERLGETAEVSS